MATVALSSEPISGDPSDRLRERVDRELRHLTPTLRAMAFARLGHGGEVEDALQETFVRVWRSLDRYRPEAPLKNWVFTIASNVIRNMMRRERIRRRPIPAAEEKASLDPREALMNAEDLQGIYRAMERLDPGEVAPLLLHYVHEIPQREVAAFLGLSVEHLRVRLYRTIRKIRNGMEERV